MADHFTPAQLAEIDATVARFHRERADAPTMAARYDEACDRIGEMHDEIVRLRRRAQALEDQLSDARAEAARESALVSEARHERDTARQEARTARREADADRVRLLGIVNEWVTTASEYGGVDHGDLVRALEGAGYTLPGADDEETDR